MSYDDEMILSEGEQGKIWVDDARVPYDQKGNLTWGCQT